MAAAGTKLLQALLQNPGTHPLEAAEALGLLQVNDAGELEKWVDEVLAAWPDKVADYRKGKKQLLGLFVGEVKKRSNGKADVKAASQLLESRLAEG
jgi:aspartyl-tRNA(Asn)/glutamyl-tRNA(Gln) amidotransferase subunit B